MKLLINKTFIGLLALLGGLLGALGGADNSSKLYRRILIPLLLTLYAIAKTNNFWVITIMLMTVALSIGYGIPDKNDSGSKLGRFLYKICHQNRLLTDIFTRGLIGKLIAISLISIPLIKTNWIIYGFCSQCIILINAFISWRNFGSYKLFHRDLSWVETITWGLITACGLSIISF